MDTLSNQPCPTADLAINLTETDNYLSYDELLNLVSPNADFFDSTHAQTDPNVFMLTDEFERLSVREFCRSRAIMTPTQTRLYTEMDSRCARVENRVVNNGR